MMSRRYESSDGESEDLPDLSTLLTVPKELQQRPSQTKREPAESDRDRHDPRLSLDSTVEYPKLEQEVARTETQFKGHKPLRLAHVNSLLLPIANLSLKSSEPRATQPNARNERAEALRQLSKRVAKKKYPQTYADSDLSDDEEERIEKDSSYDGAESLGEPEDDLSDFIVSDSASEDELRRPRRLKEKPVVAPRRRLYQRTRRRSSLSPGKAWVGTLLPNKRDRNDDGEGSRDSAPKPVEYPTLESFDEPDANLKFSPPRKKSPRKISIPTSERAVTPPQSPSKGLQTPSKSRPKIPPSPHKPDLESFWSQEAVDEWNDQYSPEKTPKSRRKYLSESREGSPTPSPSKSPAKSPAKRDKKAIAQRKQFESTKHDLATSFLTELDNKIASGNLSTLAASTGGVKIIWSRKLNSTAGRANWKREVQHSRSAKGTVTTTAIKHHASIELAEKVIDDEDRLLNVLAHEFCHLANFMISNVKDQPHGASFKSWAAKVSSAFRDKNIVVTTKHSYTIAYKYIWSCISCNQEYRRHSKSIDPAKHSCGVCKGRLAQVKPVPRGEGKGKMGEVERTAYQDFVKGNFKVVKGELEVGRRHKPSNGEVMSELARRWRVEKEKAKAAGETQEEKEVELVVLESDGEDDVGIDDVVEELDGLSLRA